MRIFISGGCKNGKSHHAQSLAKKTAQAKNLPLYYIATMKPADSEDAERIANHRREREGWGFVTVEQPVDIEQITEKCDTCGSFLLDSLTALLANEMFKQETVSDCAGKISADLSAVLKNIENIVIVSDYIYSDAQIYDGLTENYRKSLAFLDAAAARECDIVLEACYTNIIIHKGKGLYNEVF